MPLATPTLQDVGWSCPQCARANAPQASRCANCGARPDHPAEASAPERAMRPRRRPAPVRRAHPLVDGLRLLVLGYLFYALFDGSNWLMNVTTGLAPGDPAALRYSVYALYELLRNLALVGGAWALLGLLFPKRVL